MKALAPMTAAPADVVCRLKHQATRLAGVTDRGAPGAWAGRLATSARALLALPLLLGPHAPVAARLMAARVPADGVHARRRAARKPAKQTGATPSHAPWTLLAWSLLITNVLETMWQTPTVLHVDPIRWQRDPCLSPGRALAISRHSRPPKKTPPEVLCMGACGLFSSMMRSARRDAQRSGKSHRAR